MISPELVHVALVGRAASKFKSIDDASEIFRALASSMSLVHAGLRGCLESPMW